MNKVEHTMQKEYGQHVALKSLQSIYKSKPLFTKKRLIILSVLAILILFLPWTQNIQSKGKVTARQIQYRSQALQSAIPGKIVKWQVKEGDKVRQGDTLLLLAEVKTEYLDPNILDNTKDQLVAKKLALENYQQKINATGAQRQILVNTQVLKLNQLSNKLAQLRLKITSDSMDYQAALLEHNIAETQWQRQHELYNQGLVSLAALEQRQLKRQATLAKATASEIKLANARTEYSIVQLEKSQVNQEYLEKIAKNTGDNASASSDYAAGMGDMAKLENTYNSYQKRREQYFIIAPQSGQVTNILKAGIGEIIKEGEQLLTIVPEAPDLAVETFVKPVDLPLLSLGQPVNLVFDGFPAFVFSGWPAISSGMFAGKVVAIENTVNEEGLFRVIVSPVKGRKPWPAQLKMGTACQSIALLKDVAIGYEMWRNINGFPPNYYTNGKSGKDEKK